MDGLVGVSILTEVVTGGHGDITTDTDMATIMVTDMVITRDIGPDMRQGVVMPIEMYIIIAQQELSIQEITEPEQQIM